MNHTLSSVLCFATSARVKVLEGAWRCMAAVVVEAKGVSQRNNERTVSTGTQSRSWYVFISFLPSSLKQGSAGLRLVGLGRAVGACFGFWPGQASAPERFGNLGRGMWGPLKQQ